MTPEQILRKNLKKNFISKKKVKEILDKELYADDVVMTGERRQGIYTKLGIL